MKRRLFLRLQIALALLLAFGNPALAANEDEADRKIQPADTIIVEVFGEEKLTVIRRVQAAGAITYPLLGDIDVKGQTTSQVSAFIRKRLADDYLVDPHVSVTVKEYRSRTVSVLGQVERGGSIELLPEQKMDVIDAIARAGNFTRYANRNRIELTRNGETKRYEFDKLREETDSKKKIWLEPGDVIYVHETRF